VDFIVMELIEGRSLAAHRRPVSVGEGLAVAEQIGSALEAAHAAGIVHRDVKPANVRPTPTGHVKVLDFGIATRLTAALPDAATVAVTTSTHRYSHS
jgi:eukaryotic-like serine/threonine-protein kinase